MTLGIIIFKVLKPVIMSFFMGKYQDEEDLIKVISMVARKECFI